jgi:hypothetical protein
MFRYRRKFMANRRGKLSEYSHVNRIPQVSIDDAGFIHTACGSYHPVTGEGDALDMPEAMKMDILRALIHDSLDSGPAELHDWDAFMKRKFGSNRP